MKRLFILITFVCASWSIYAEDIVSAQMNTTGIDSLTRNTQVADTLAIEPDIVHPHLLDSMPGVQVLQDSAIARLLLAAMEGGEEWIEISGYRVQVYSSNQQQTAKAEALRLENRLKDQLNQTVYVQYAPPFWKVRIGDFRTYEEAKNYKREVVELFPQLVGNTYIVRDQIKVLK